MGVRQRFGHLCCNVLRAVCSPVAVTWPGGGNDVPSDRVGEAHSLGVWLFFIVIAGVCLAFIVGGMMHRAHIYFFPESGATVRFSQPECGLSTRE